ncbi:hypothetical protein GCM10011504_45620 [Siccirubricoccus deserti]|uniref:Type II toxin-antitoxin system VapC family toxin n=1 Tax=Siccirubricoccus deserti TaxID=2013562 RepID=A0A9X0UJD9_9PROT|nr:type II toxin-antitoxin system VapC family toxin [Siccirubricoccus deserti]MBC4018010.1 type II toxin-antitoxin system VapC family toxin [Siccirubricoccus deserti]GGC62255.1 hypothetical protein GCM10011504_45620 [Siccirubricoccus deserti]
MTSALLRKQHRGEGENGIASAALGHRAALRVIVVPNAALLQEAAALSQRMRHAVYDCLVLARRRQLRVATFDHRLAGLATTLAIPLWHPEAP